MEKTSKPTVAGILAIIAGVLGLILAVSYFIGFGVVSGALGIPTGYIPEFVPGYCLGYGYSFPSHCDTGFGRWDICRAKEDVGVGTCWFNRGYLGISTFGNTSCHTYRPIQE